jgi:hypothetical protein
MRRLHVRLQRVEIPTLIRENQKKKYLNSLFYIKCFWRLIFNLSKLTDHLQYEIKQSHNSSKI